MLHELDRELEQKRLRYVRYADDFSIYLKTKHEAKKVGNNVFLFLKQRLKLPINRAKSGIRRPAHYHPEAAAPSHHAPTASPATATSRSTPKTEPDTSRLSAQPDTQCPIPASSTTVSETSIYALKPGIYR